MARGCTVAARDKSGGVTSCGEESGLFDVRSNKEWECSVAFGVTHCWER